MPLPKESSSAGSVLTGSASAGGGAAGRSDSCKTGPDGGLISAVCTEITTSQAVSTWMSVGRSSVAAVPVCPAVISGRGADVAAISLSGCGTAGDEPELEVGDSARVHDSGTAPDSPAGEFVASGRGAPDVDWSGLFGSTGCGPRRPRSPLRSFRPPRGRSPRAVSDRGASPRGLFSRGPCPPRCVSDRCVSPRDPLPRAPSPAVEPDRELF